jgi:hypothetical protein
MSNIIEYLAKDLSIKLVNDVEKTAELFFPERHPKEQFFKRAMLMALVVAVRDESDYVERTTELFYDTLEPLNEREFKMMDSILSIYPHFYHDDVPATWSDDIPF